MADLSQREAFEFLHKKDPEFRAASPAKQKQMMEAFAAAGKFNLVPDMEHNEDTTTLEDVAKPMVAPAAGGAVGNLIGQVAGGLLTKNPAGARVGGGIGEAAGNYAGEKVNQALGVTPESELAAGVQGASPLAGRGIAAVAKWGATRLPGAGGAMQQMAVDLARSAPKRYMNVPSPSGPLFEAVERAGNPYVKLNKMSKVSQDLFYELSDSLISNNPARAPLLGLLSELEQAGKTGARLSTVRHTMTEIGEMVDKSPLDPNVKKGMLKKLYGSFADSLDDAAAGSKHHAFALLDQAKTSYKRELVQAELADVIENQGIRNVQDGYLQVNANTVLNYIKNNRQDLVKRLGPTGPAELSAMENEFREIGKYRSIPVKAGVPIGSGRRIGSTAAGAAVAGKLGADPMTGAAVGAVSGEVISRLLMTEPGRKFVHAMFRASHGQIGENELGMAMSFLSGALNPSRPVITPEHILGTPQHGTPQQ